MRPLRPRAAVVFFACPCCRAGVAFGFTFAAGCPFPARLTLAAGSPAPALAEALPAGFFAPGLAGLLPAGFFARGFFAPGFAGPLPAPFFAAGRARFLAGGFAAPSRADAARPAAASARALFNS
ncbi:MAG: hypothetical protein V2J16_10100, partial [Thermoleophilia bacterium]|nr:hypothetical protein [Thermoleophilia bacterium]